MKQYCRYCSFCFAADDYRCSDYPKGQEPHWTREQINRPNHCPNFDLSPCGDVDTGRIYKPREERENQAIEGQITIEEVMSCVGSNSIDSKVDV